MKQIKDSVHDHIHVEGAARALLDTPTVQRLRRIKQLGTVSLVYPSANHTRFEHSLGVYHLASRTLEHLNVGGDRAEHVRAAALLHDIGHTPYSHNVEGLLERPTGISHTDVGDLLSNGPVADVLDEHGLDPDRIAALVAGEGKFGGLISGELDVDRMDYLVRDAHHTGVPNGTIDHGRLVRELKVVEGNIVLREGNVQSAESLLLARALMYPTVYNHHVARISKSMLRRATERMLDTDGYEPLDLRGMDDHDLFAALRNNPDSADLARRISDRDLFKRAVWAEREDVPNDLVGGAHQEIRRAERSVAEAAGVDPESVILDVPEEPRMRETSTRVVVSGEVRRLEEQSALVEALRDAQAEQWRFGIYTPEKRLEAVGHAAEQALGLETGGHLVSERAGRYVPLDEFGVN
jgi:HD superfamily phosphohydrolase